MKALKPLDNETKDNVRRPRRIKPIPIDPREKKRIITHFNRRVSRLEIIATTQTRRGQILDWIPRESQVRGKIANPPPEPKLRVPSRAGRKIEIVRFDLEHPDAERGPKGTVPVLRKDLTKLRFHTSLENYLSKHGHKTRTLFLDGRHAMQQPEIGGPGGLGPHDYAFTGQSVTCYGGEGSISAYDPFTWSSKEFSLGQIALSRVRRDSVMQTLEGGQQEFRDKYGDWVPHLFVYYTTNGYASDGDNKGGYNQEVDGWVQYSDSIHPGATSSPTSTPGGAQYIMQIKYQLYQGNWWFCCNGHWIGYYPASLFSVDGLRTQADAIAFYGEIVDSSAHKEATWTDMGSGYWPEDGWPWAGYMSNLRYQSDAAGGTSDYNADSVWATDTTEYDVEAHMNSGTSWGSYFWFGGPGAG